VLDAEPDLATELLRDTLSQQTCWIGDVSRVGPAHQGDRGARRGRSRCALRRLDRGEVARQHLPDDGGSNRGRRGSLEVRLRGLGVELSDGMIDAARAKARFKV